MFLISLLLVLRGDSHVPIMPPSLHLEYGPSEPRDQVLYGSHERRSGCAKARKEGTMRMSGVSFLDQEEGPA